MPRPRRLHADLRTTWFEHASTQVATLLVIGAIGAGALSATGTESARDAMRAAAATSSATAMHRTTEAVPTSGVPRRHQPSAHASHPAAGHPVVRAAAAQRASRSRPAVSAAAWTPQGIGMWIYEWARTSRGRARAVVARARHTGLSTLYLRTGSSWDGLSGGGHLRHLLRATGGTGIHVVAWDFPRLRHPRRDAHRLARAARISVGRQHLHVAAVAPDIETPAEGTANASWRVALYLNTLRGLLPHGMPVLTAVPWPSRFRIGSYPYRTVAARSNVLVPMAYWYNNSPSYVTAHSIHYLRQFHRPVAPVGQGYDGRIDVPGLRHNNLSKQLPAFLHAAHRAGARAVSVWSWQAAPKPVWRAIKRNHRLFPSHR